MSMIVLFFTIVTDLYIHCSWGSFSQTFSYCHQLLSYVFSHENSSMQQSMDFPHPSDREVPWNPSHHYLYLHSQHKDPYFVVCWFASARLFSVFASVGPSVLAGRVHPVILCLCGLLGLSLNSLGMLGTMGMLFLKVGYAGYLGYALPEARICWRACRVVPGYRKASWRVCCVLGNRVYPWASPEW